ncbi:maltose O-acetyltransferase [Pseudoclavibacter endophyticus]|uniref:Sugar O-acetyltransferase n=1 Tax=Pseudoclavibacter endophyticus TaxID=1778590 RepID=A0A6H9WRP4_9MICO|nr:sugar O-acetyltransferase [Pseudoclavibacter endophyticus]KAB1649617.1 sugar O-acetyltransferase [Pseudoclavibacter endophyticus]GGA61188.1 maltose O-acetyltransferase [Pseudoclavibacter endophyticus]
MSDGSGGASGRAAGPDSAAPRTQLERRTAGLPYVGDAEVADRGARALALTQQYREAMLRDHDEARGVLATLLGTYGEGAHIVPPLFVDDGANLHIGDRVFINAGLTALDVVPIHIGADSQLGPNVQLLAPTHPINPELRAAGVEAGEPITIEDGVWLGGGVIVTPGVTIGAGSVVGAGAVVTRSIPPRSVAVGNPARVIRSVDEQSDREAARWAATADALGLAGRDQPDLTPRFGV